ncbi:MAG: hypothetical protein MI919_33165 [Holophagales bacterium]|nr:hypothetical protein [Holophagales bacterium]
MRRTTLDALVQDLQLLASALLLSLRQVPGRLFGTRLQADGARRVRVLGS